VIVPLIDIRSASAPIDRLRSERGEGVISAAIAVLVMAFIGVAMWLAFSNTFDRAADRTDELVDQIGD
jgi:hypothetical protein